MVWGRFYSLCVESPSGYDILSISGFLPSPPHAAHSMHHHIMGMRPHVSHTTSAAAACRRAHVGRVLDDCSALPDWRLRGAVTDGHGAGWQAMALRPQEKRRAGIPVLGLS